jgi:hypothetical protein
VQLYDAALVANKKHAAAWHGWGLLEKRQGNLMKAKDLWMRVCPVHPYMSQSHLGHCFSLRMPLLSMGHSACVYARLGSEIGSAGN